MVRNRTQYESIDGRCGECGSSNVLRDVRNDRVVCRNCKHSVPLTKFEENNR